MEHFPRAEQKINDYVERIKNGEDKEAVLEGLGPAFRNPVEERLKVDSSPAQDTDEQKIAQLREELGIIPRRPIDMMKVAAPDSTPKEEIQEGIPEAVPVQETSTENIPSLERHLSPEEIKHRKSLNGWVASYTLAHIAQEEGVDLSALSREEYADYAIDHYLAIDDAQLRAKPWQRMATSVDEAIAQMRAHKSLIQPETEALFHRFSHEMMELAKKDQKDRFIAESVRVLSGTAESNSWLFFSINEGPDTANPDTYKSYLSLKDLNAFSPEQYKEFMVALQKRGYNGGVKIFQDLTDQGSVLGDQIVMHGFSEEDAALALSVAVEIFGENIESTSLGKDEYQNGVSKSYSQLLAEKIKTAIKDKE